MGEQTNEIATRQGRSDDDSLMLVILNIDARNILLPTSRWLLYSLLVVSSSCVFSFSCLNMFRFPRTRRVRSLSASVIFSQFCIRLKVPSEFTTIGPRLSSLKVEEYDPSALVVDASAEDGRASCAVCEDWSDMVLRVLARHTRFSR